MKPITIPMGSPKRNHPWKILPGVASCIGWSNCAWLLQVPGVARPWSARKGRNPWVTVCFMVYIGSIYGYRWFISVYKWLTYIYIYNMNLWCMNLYGWIYMVSVIYVYICLYRYMVMFMYVYMVWFLYLECLYICMVLIWLSRCWYVVDGVDMVFTHFYS